MLGFLNAASAGGGWIRFGEGFTLNNEVNKKIIVCQNSFTINLGEMLQNQENIIENIGDGEIIIQSPTNPAFDKLIINNDETPYGWCKLAAKQIVHTRYLDGYLRIYGTVAAQGTNIVNASYLFGQNTNNLTWTVVGTTKGTYAHEAYYETRQIVKDLSEENTTLSAHNKIQVLWEYNSGANGWYPYRDGVSSEVYMSSKFDATPYKRVYVVAYRGSSNTAGYVSIGSTILKPDSEDPEDPSTLVFNVEGDSYGTETEIKIGCKSLSVSAPSWSGTDGQSYSSSKSASIYVSEIRITNVIDESLEPEQSEEQEPQEQQGQQGS